MHLSLCDYIPAHGPIADITMSIAKNGVRSSLNYGLSLYVD